MITFFSMKMILNEKLKRKLILRKSNFLENLTDETTLESARPWQLMIRPAFSRGFRGSEEKKESRAVMKIAAARNHQGKVNPFHV